MGAAVWFTETLVPLWKSTQCWDSRWLWS